MGHLVYLVHADPSVGHLYRDALSHVSPDVTLIHVNAFEFGGLSSAYVKLAATMHRPLLPEVRKRFRAPDAWDSLTVATYSAGYAFARELLKQPEDRDAIDCLVLIDSLHTGLDPDGTASDAGLADFVDFARLALDGRKVFWVGHTDVPTTGYASTTQTAAELERLAGAPNGTTVHVQAFDLAKDHATEHGYALTRWGAEWVAGALRQWTEAHGGPIELAPNPTGLGARALALAVKELDAGVCEEPPGSNSGPRIKAYLSGCERDGQKIGLSAGEWCAAAASWCAFSGADRGESVPHGWRASVRELWADAKASGAARPPSYVPSPGDLCILARAGDDPTKGGKGHVCRVEAWAGPMFTTLDGNHGVAWGRVHRELGKDPVVGWIAYPDGRAAEVPSPAALVEAARLRTLSDDVWLGRFGLQEGTV